MENIDRIIQDENRLNALYAYNILDTDAEQDFNEIVELASKICNTPISLISLLDDKRQWFKAKVGVEVNETPVELAFCRHAIANNNTFVVENTLNDERFAHNPLVTEQPSVRFYAGAPLTTPTGENIGTLCVIDTVQKQLTQEQMDALRILAKQVVKQLELRKSVKALEQSKAVLAKQNESLIGFNDFKTKVLSVIGHDLKSPMAIINSLLSLLVSEDITAEEFKTHAETLQRETKQSEITLTNLLSWAERHFEQKDLVYHQTSLISLLQNAVEWNNTFVKAKQINVQYNCLPQNETAVKLDEQAVHIILRNLINNAIKFSKPGQTITLSAHCENNTLLLAVKDDGVGMDSQQLSSLFNSKEHFSEYGTKGEKGAGIGLLLSKSFCDSLNGKLWAESSPGLGTTFKCEFPL